MAFNQDNFASVGANSTDAPAVYSYDTTDTLATVGGALYFNDKVYQLEANDIILVNASDGFAIFQSDGAGAASAKVSESNKQTISGYVTFSGSTPTLVASSGVDSLIDDGTGEFRIVPTTNFPNINYVITGSSIGGRYVGDNGASVARAVDAVPISVRTSAGALSDTEFSFQVTEI